MQPQTTSTTGSLDQDAVNLAKAIRQTESGGNFQAKGKSGEYGAYQYTKDTWNKDATKYGVNVPLEQATPEQQNEVAYKKIKELKDAGHNVGEVASIWNSGNPTAYLDPSYTGTNKHGAKFDVPAYAKSVATAYQTLKQGGEVNADPNNPSSTASTDNVQPDTKGTLHKIADWAFPILQDFSGEGAKKTALQKLGDAGLSAMWFLPGLGEAGEALRGGKAVVEGGEALAKSGGLLSKVGKGALSGYGADVASNLSQGKTGGDILKPGLGSVTGGVLGGALGKLGEKYSQEGVVNDFAKENNSVLGQTKRGANDLAESFSRGKDTGDFLAKKGINLKSLINPDTVAYETTDKASELRKGASLLNSTLTDALKNVGGSVTVNDLETQLLSQVPKNYPERADLIKREMGLLKQQYGDVVSVADLNEWKQRAWDFSKFDMAVPSDTRKTYRTIGHTLKDKIEEVAKKNGLDGVKEFNDYLGSHLDAADSLDTLNGTKGKGGRLGDLMQKHTLGAIGGVSGFFGGGPVGSLVGALAGEYAGGKLSGVLRKIGSSPIRTAILNRLEQEDPQIVQKFIEFSKQESPVVAQLRKEMGGTLGKTMGSERTGNVSPLLKPKPTNPGLILRNGAKLGSRAVVSSGSSSDSKQK